MVIFEKIKRSPKIVTLMLAALSLLGVATFSAYRSSMLEAQTNNVCSGTTVSMWGSGSSTSTISGIANITVALSTSMIEKPGKVVILLDGQEVGQARATQSSSYGWSMQLPTRYLDPSQAGQLKSYQLKAKLRYATFECYTNAISTLPVDNGGLVSDFGLQPQSPQIETPVNTTVPVSANIISPDFSGINFTQYALFDWATESRGTVSANNQNNITTFFAGPSAGEGKVKVVARFGKRVHDAAIPTRVLPADSPISTSTTPSTTTTTTSSGDATTTTTTNNTGETTTTTTTTDPETNEVVTEVQRTTTVETNTTTGSCAVAALGEERFNAINSGTARPTIEEINKLKACFALTRYILPSNFAPVAPAKVAELPVSSAIKIAALKNEIREDGEKQKEVLRLSGTAAPNSTVVVYLFSEPLVLTTTADDNGEWVYELEDPLEPGDHTIYAVVDKGDGVFEKTDPFSFVIGTAEASAENPSGLSLALDERQTPQESSISTLLYVGSSAAMLAVISVIAFVVYKKSRHRHDAIVPSTDSAPAVAGSEVVNNVIAAPIMPTQEPTAMPQATVEPTVAASPIVSPQETVEPTPEVQNTTVIAPTVEVAPTIDTSQADSNVNTDAVSTDVDTNTDEKL